MSELTKEQIERLTGESAIDKFEDLISEQKESAEGSIRFRYPQLAKAVDKYIAECVSANEACNTKFRAKYKPNL